MSNDSGKLTPQIMVLGLVIRKPDTATGIQKRLKTQFPEARFSPNAASRNLPSLVERGYVRLVDVGGGIEHYEALPAGYAYFVDEWLHTSKQPPPVRDAYLGKLEFLEYADIPVVVAHLKAEEEALEHDTDSAHAKLLTHKRFRRGRSGTREEQFRARMRAIRYEDAANLTGVLAQRDETLRGKLETVIEEFADVLAERAERGDTGAQAAGG